jgi:hypothetical protein
MRRNILSMGLFDFISWRGKETYNYSVLDSEPGGKSMSAVRGCFTFSGVDFRFNDFYAGKPGRLDKDMDYIKGVLARWDSGKRTDSMGLDLEAVEIDEMRATLGIDERIKAGELFVFAVEAVVDCDQVERARAEEADKKAKKMALESYQKAGLPVMGGDADGESPEENA